MSRSQENVGHRFIMRRCVRTLSGFKSGYLVCVRSIHCNILSGCYELYTSLLELGTSKYVTLIYALFYSCIILVRSVPALHPSVLLCITFFFSVLYYSVFLCRVSTHFYLMKKYVLDFELS